MVFEGAESIDTQAWLIDLMVDDEMRDMIGSPGTSTIVQRIFHRTMELGKTHVRKGFQLERQKEFDHSGACYAVSKDTIAAQSATIDQMHTRYEKVVTILENLREEAIDREEYVHQITHELEVSEEMVQDLMRQLAESEATNSSTAAAVENRTCRNQPAADICMSWSDLRPGHAEFWKCLDQPSGITLGPPAWRIWPGPRIF